MAKSDMTEEMRELFFDLFRDLFEKRASTLPTDGRSEVAVDPTPQKIGGAHGG